MTQAPVKAQMAQPTVYNVVVSPTEITVRLTSAAQLFRAPEADPFLPNEVEILGQSGMDRIITRILARRARTRDIKRLTVHLPASQIDATTQPEVAAAIHRYGAVRIEDNNLQIRAVVAQAIRKMIIVAIFLAIFFLVVAGFWFYGNLQDRPAIDTLLGYSIVLIVWVTWWTPVGSLFFDWIPYYRENAVLKYLMGMAIVVTAQDAAAPRPEKNPR